MSKPTRKEQMMIGTAYDYLIKLSNAAVACCATFAERTRLLNVKCGVREREIIIKKERKIKRVREMLRLDCAAC